MTGEEMERAIEFLLKSHADLTAAQTQASNDIASLASTVGELTGVVVDLADVVARLETQMDRMEAQAESDRQETREAINNLIIANEVTRDLTKQVASLEVQTSKRVTYLDQRVSDLESR